MMIVFLIAQKREKCISLSLKALWKDKENRVTYSLGIVMQSKVLKHRLDGYLAWML